MRNMRELPQETHRLIDWDNPSEDDKLRMAFAQLAGCLIERCDKQTRRGRCRGIARWYFGSSLQAYCSFHANKIGWYQIVMDLVARKTEKNTDRIRRRKIEQEVPDWR